MNIIFLAAVVLSSRFVQRLLHLQSSVKRWAISTLPALLAPSRAPCRQRNSVLPEVIKPLTPQATTAFLQFTFLQAVLVNH